MNPVRAGLVAHSADYQWSSYRVNARHDHLDWLTPQAEYLALGSDREARQRNYRRLFHENFSAELIEEIRTPINGIYAPGNERFRTEVERMLQRRASPGKPGRPARPG